MAAGEQRKQDQEPERQPASALSPAAEPDFMAVLRHLRARGEPCAPPSGVGSFLPLYANDVEVVVWYLPAREGHLPGEVAIPCARLAAVWTRLMAGERLTRETLEAEGERPGRALWLLAVLAQVPGVRAQADPLTIWWEPPLDVPATEASAQEVGGRIARHTSSKRRTRSARQPAAEAVAEPSATARATPRASRRGV